MSYPVTAAHTIFALNKSIMALKVSDYGESVVFCKDYGDISVKGVSSGGLVVRYEFERYQEGIIDTLEETYHPNKNGQVRIKGVGEMARRNAPVWAFSTQKGLEAYRYASVNLNMSFSSGEDNASLKRRFLYADVATEGMHYQGISECFLTRYSTRRILPGQPVTLAFHFNGRQTLSVGVAYIDRPGHAAYVSWPVGLDNGQLEDGVEQYFIHKADCITVMDRLNEETQGEFAEDDMLWYTFTLQTEDGAEDTVRFEVDHRKYPVTSILLYQNCFGLSESIALHGVETVTAEMEGTFGTMGQAYRKIFTWLDYVHESNTGYLGPDDREAFEDLLRSPKVYLGSVAEENEVVITETDAEEVLPHAGPVNFKVKWKRVNASYRRFRNKAVAATDTGVFDRSFDKSFE